LSENKDASQKYPVLCVPQRCEYGDGGRGSPDINLKGKSKVLRGSYKSFLPIPARQRRRRNDAQRLQNVCSGRIASRCLLLGTPRGIKPAIASLLLLHAVYPPILTLLRARLAKCLQKINNIPRILNKIVSGIRSYCIT
jgi:hypothetical protein